MNMCEVCNSSCVCRTEIEERKKKLLVCDMCMYVRRKDPNIFTWFLKVIGKLT